MKFSPNATVLEKLLAELQDVTKYFSLDFDIGVSRGWQVTAYLSERHRSVDTRHGGSGESAWTTIRSDDQASASLELAVEDVLERIALAAPLEVSA